MENQKLVPYVTNQRKVVIHHSKGFVTNTFISRPKSYIALPQRDAITLNADNNKYDEKALEEYR